jgi:hypothetical protein
MLRVIITSLLAVNALFWGLFPHSDHCQMATWLGMKKCPSHYIHLGLGLVFYISAVLTAQQSYIQHLWL